MKFSAIFSAAMVFGSALASTTLVCNQDNCYRNIQHQTTAGPAFCSTLTNPNMPTATFTRANCDYSRYSSACSCVVPATPGVTPTSVPCYQDDCYRNLQHNLGLATDYCSTLTAPTNTARPTFIRDECNDARLSSACSCVYPATVAPVTGKSALLLLI